MVLSGLVIVWVVHIVVSFVAVLLVNLVHVLSMTLNLAPHILDSDDVTHDPFILSLATPPLRRR
jgi:hypothetical protein